MGWSPETNEHLAHLIASSLVNQFPGLRLSERQRMGYEIGILLHHEKTDILGVLNPRRHKDFDSQAGTSSENAHISHP